MPDYYRDDSVRGVEDTPLAFAGVLVTLALSIGLPLYLSYARGPRNKPARPPAAGAAKPAKADAPRPSAGACRCPRGAPPPLPCTNWTRLILPPVLSGHVSSFPPCEADTSRPSPRGVTGGRGWLRVSGERAARVLTCSAASASRAGPVTQRAPRAGAGGGGRGARRARHRRDRGAPPPLPRTNRASLVPSLVLSGHAASSGSKPRRARRRRRRRRRQRRRGGAGDHQGACRPALRCAGRRGGGAAGRRDGGAAGRRGGGAAGRRGAGRPSLRAPAGR
jgi:hypothetical protein